MSFIFKFNLSQIVFKKFRKSNLLQSSSIPNFIDDTGSSLSLSRTSLAIEINGCSVRR
jgi:hypothetical protein